MFNTPRVRSVAMKQLPREVVKSSAASKIHLDIRTCHSLWFGGSGLGPIFRAAISPESTEDSNPNGLKARFDEDYLDVPGS